MSESKFLYRRIEPGDIKRFYGVDDPHGDIKGWIWFTDGEPIGVCASMRDPELLGTLLEDDARLFGFLDVKGKPAATIGMVGIKQIRKHLREETREPLYVQCDDVNFPHAPKLLALLGFEPTEETRLDRRNGKFLKVWRWQPLAQW